MKNYLISGENEMKMKTIVASSIALFCSLTIAVQVCSAQTVDLVGPPKPVIVVNTAANPVPVTGTVSGSVSVTNTLDVNAQQSGPWVVGIVGSPTIKIDPEANLVIAKTGSPRLHYNSGPINPAGFGTFISPGGEKIRIYASNRCESSQEFKIDSVLEGNVIVPVKSVNVGAGDHYTEVFEMLGGLLRLTNSGGACENGTVRWFVYTN